ncbi:hypothetical protein F4820DRAFT_250543 [Hypoxylon rubiginosum]|uniref:Uncharacterized protein n=1 Tax=Hypoxylon rubiginosum TaxID=110542 RepID=A0ACB9Z542_9PEZI|nr:hypothetical protein F4820DRAFT_250543 [Hypoxylon rubiginosum]
MEGLFEIMDIDMRRVAARAVGRTPKEHEDLERALAARRARAARFRFQQRQQHRRLRLNKERTSWELEFYNEDSEFSGTIGCNADEAEADRLEAAERDPRMVETRRLLREHRGLSTNDMTVLLLVTQIPRGRWTDFRTLQEHIHRTKTRPELSCLGSGASGRGGRRIANCLARNPFGNDRVPCHRVVETRYPDGVVRLGAHARDGDFDLLTAEGARFDVDDWDEPLSMPFRDFRGCPRVALYPTFDWEACIPSVGGWSLRVD